MDIQDVYQKIKEIVANVTWIPVDKISASMHMKKGLGIYIEHGDFSPNLKEVICKVESFFGIGSEKLTRRCIKLFNEATDDVTLAKFTFLIEREVRAKKALELYNK